MPTKAVPDARGPQWRKVIFNAATNPVGAITGLTHGRVCEDPALRRLVSVLVDEGKAVAAAQGIELDADPEDLIDHAARPDVAYGHKASMLQDVEARRQTEIDYLNGGLVRVRPRPRRPDPGQRGDLGAGEGDGTVMGAGMRAGRGPAPTGYRASIRTGRSPIGPPGQAFAVAGLRSAHQAGSRRGRSPTGPPWAGNRGGRSPIGPPGGQPWGPVSDRPAPQANVGAGSHPARNQEETLATQQAEIERRYERVREAAGRDGLDAVIVAGNEYTGFEGAVTYLSGFVIVHRYAYVLLPLDEPPAIVFPSEARYVGEHGTTWIEEQELRRPGPGSGCATAAVTAAGSGWASSASTTS